MKLSPRKSRLLTSNVLLLPSLLLLVFVIVVPLVDLLIESFRPQLGSGGFTFANYTQVFGQRLYEDQILNTLHMHWRNHDYASHCRTRGMGHDPHPGAAPTIGYELAGDSLPYFLPLTRLFDACPFGRKRAPDGPS